MARKYPRPHCSQTFDIEVNFLDDCLVTAGIYQIYIKTSMPIQLLFTSPSLFVAWILAIIYSITVHEFSHAFAGHLQGDTTAEDEGRLTLNPLAHLDWLGLALLVLVGFGWGKPVPFNPYQLKHRRLGPALVGFAGPIANLLSVIVFGILLKVLVVTQVVGADNLLFTFISFLIQINVVLMVFNLLPIPPLDGSKVLYAFLGIKHLNIIAWLERYGIWLLIILIFVGSPVLSRIFQSVVNLVYALVL